MLRRFLRIEPGETFEKSYPFSRSSFGAELPTLHLLTVLLKDGTSDGNSKVAQQVREERLGEKIQLHRMLKVFEKEGFSSKDIKAVKGDVTAALDAGEYEARIVRKQLLPSSSMDDKLSEDLKSGLHWGREKMLRKFETLEQLPTERQEQGLIELKTELRSCSQNSNSPIDSSSKGRNVRLHAGENNMTLRDFYLKRAKAEFPVFLKVLRALPSDLSYKPDERSPSAEQLVWTLTYELKALIDVVDTGKSEWENITPPGLGEMTEMYEKWSTELLDKVARLDDASQQRNAQFLYQGQVVMEKPLVEFIWDFMFDAIHHRGQLSAYLRPMGGKVPSIYGPSADDPGM